MALHLFPLFVIALCSGSAALEDVAEEEAGNTVSLLQSRVNLVQERDQKQRLDPPQLIVDLDVEPDKRWRNVTARFWAFDFAFLTQRLPSEVEAVAKAVVVDKVYREELTGILRDMRMPQNEANFNKLLAFQFFYELSGSQDGRDGVVGIPPLEKLGENLTGCSGLLAAMPNGTVVHGRNLDYHDVNLAGIHLRDFTVEVLFMRGGRPLYTSVHYPLQIGIHTAMRFDGWSFAQNTRYHMYESSVLSGLYEGSGGFFLGARSVMESTGDFEEAVQRLYALNLMAPSYFIVAGTKPYQGAVITVDRGGVHVPTTPLIRRLSPTEGIHLSGRDNYTNWYTFQTNDDVNKAPIDSRRPAGELMLSKADQQSVSPEWVLRTLDTPPVFNDLTLLTSIYVPATGHHRTILYSH